MVQSLVINGNVVMTDCTSNIRDKNRNSTADQCIGRTKLSKEINTVICQTSMPPHIQFQ